eukprot:1721118-Amphidinium_carterae.3
MDEGSCFCARCRCPVVAEGHCYRASSYHSYVDAGHSTVFASRPRDWSSVLAGMCMLYNSTWSWGFVLLLTLCALLRLCQPSPRPVKCRPSSKAVTLPCEDPLDAIGVRMSSLSSYRVTGARSTVRGDGNCFWRASCRGVHWRAHKNVTIKATSDLCSNSCHPEMPAHSEFHQHVLDAGRKNRWVHRDMLAAYAAATSTSVIVCQALNAGTHCNAWQPLFQFRPTHVRRTLFVAYNGYHYDKLSVRKRAHAYFMAERGELHKVSASTCEGGGRKRPSAAMDESTDAGLRLLTNTDDEKATSAALRIRVRWIRKATSLLIGDSACSIAQVGDCLAAAGHFARSRLLLRNLEGEALHGHEVCAPGNDLELLAVLTPPTTDRRRRKSHRSNFVEQESREDDMGLSVQQRWEPVVDEPAAVDGLSDEGSSLVDSCFEQIGTPPTTSQQIGGWWNVELLRAREASTRSCFAKLHVFGFRYAAAPGTRVIDLRMALKRKLRLHVSRIRLLLDGQTAPDELVASRATPAFTYQIVARSSSLDRHDGVGPECNVDSL